MGKRNNKAPSSSLAKGETCSRPQSSRKSSHGGKRPGAGRKTGPVKVIHREVEQLDGNVLAQVRAALEAFAPACVANLVTLANGGYERVERRFEAAGTVLVRGPILDAKGDFLLDAKGNPVVAETKVFPDLPDDELVLVAQTVSFAEPDRAANIYMLDRLLGKPKQAVSLSSEDDAMSVRLALAEQRALEHVPDRAPGR